MFKNKLSLFLVFASFVIADNNAYGSFFDKESPTDIKSPFMMLNKRQDGKLERYNFGIDTVSSLGYDEIYSNVTTIKTQLNSFDFKTAYLVNSFVSLYGKISLDTAALTNSSFAPSNFVNRLSNSRIVLNTGYFLLGNLDVSPVYAYGGQVGLPYGKNFAPSNATNLSERISQVTARAFAVGIAKEIQDVLVNPEMFMFFGDTLARTAYNMPTYGFNLSSKADSWSIQAGWLSNIADGNGYQRTSSSLPGMSNDSEFDYGDDLSVPIGFSWSNGFVMTGGFATSKNFEAIQNAVSAASFAGKLELLNDITVSGAYALALRSFDYRDLTFRNTGTDFSDLNPPLTSEGARPSAWNIYVQKLVHDFEFRTGLEGSNQALGLNIPAQRWTCGVSRKLDAFVELDLEFKKDTNYSNQYDALGPARADVSINNPVHVDGDTSNFAYSISNAVGSDGFDDRGKTAFDIVLSMKIKF